MLKATDEGKIDNIICKLEYYLKTNPILPYNQLVKLNILIDALKKSNKSLDHAKRLIENALIEVNDEVEQEAIMSSPFSCNVPKEHVPDERSFLRGFSIFKSPFIIAVWLESFLWSGSINQAAYESLQRWGLEKSVTDLQKILEECKSQLTLQPQAQQAIKHNWYRIGFYAALNAGLAITTQIALSKNEESQLTI